MGKAQKKRAIRRHNPMRVPDFSFAKGSESEASATRYQMESTESVERKWACVAVSNLIQNDPSTRRLLQGKNIVGALISRLTDSEQEVVVEAAGALRNLCIDGGYEICAEMYNKNILVPLQTFVPKISATLSQFLESPKTAPENVQKVVYEFADNVITTLWCLSETSNKALNAINAIHLIPFLMSFLAARDKLPMAPVVSAAQCLYILTDDNEPVIADVKSDAGYISCLVSIVQPSADVPQPKDPMDHRLVTLRVLAAGILRNISPIPPPSATSFVDIDKDIVLPLLQPVISSVALSDISNTVQELVQREASEPQIEKLSLKNTPKSDHKSKTELELEKLEGRLRTVQLALEVLTGACATLPDPEVGGPDEEGEEGDDNGEEDMIDDVDEDMAVDHGAAANPSTELLASSIPTSLVSPLLSLLQPTALSFPPLAAPSIHPPTTSALSAIHVSALECLNNLFLSLATSQKPSASSDKEAGLTVWNDVWSALKLVGTETGPGQERRQEMWEVAIGVLWGVGNVWKGLIEPVEEQVRLLIQLCNGSTDSMLRVKCIGTLECLAQFPNSIDGNRVISEYLLSLLPTEATPSTLDTEPLIQAVSALIDIYSNEETPYDVNFRQGNYQQRLIASMDGVRKAVRSINRGKEGGRELKRRGEEVRDNLVAFIKYRRNLKL
ncbi:armadillo-type protein [Amanita rubescens]|nr:armadillo-type protein [Amanita rubescens]